MKPEERAKDVMRRLNKFGSHANAEFIAQAIREAEESAREEEREAILDIVTQGKRHAADLGTNPTKAKAHVAAISFNTCESIATAIRQRGEG